MCENVAVEADFYFVFFSVNTDLDLTKLQNNNKWLLPAEPARNMSKEEGNQTISNLSSLSMYQLVSMDPPSELDSYTFLSIGKQLLMARKIRKL